MPKYTYIVGDDWEAIYKDGKLMAEDHNFSVRRLFKILDIEVDVQEVNLDWLGDRGRFPVDLAEVELI